MALVRPLISVVSVVTFVAVAAGCSAAKKEKPSLAGQLRADEKIQSRELTYRSKTPKVHSVDEWDVYKVTSPEGLKVIAVAYLNVPAPAEASKGANLGEHAAGRTPRFEYVISRGGEGALDLDSLGADQIESFLRAPDGAGKVTLDGRSRSGAKGKAKSAVLRDLRAIVTAYKKKQAATTAPASRRGTLRFATLDDDTSLADDTDDAVYLGDGNGSSQAQGMACMTRGVGALLGFALGSLFLHFQDRGADSVRDRCPSHSGFP